MLHCCKMNMCSWLLSHTSSVRTARWLLITCNFKKETGLHCISIYYVLTWDLVLIFSLFHFINSDVDICIVSQHVHVMKFNIPASVINRKMLIDSNLINFFIILFNQCGETINLKAKRYSPLQAPLYATGIDLPRLHAARLISHKLRYVMPSVPHTNLDGFGATDLNVFSYGGHFIAHDTQCGIKFWSSMQCIECGHLMFLQEAKNTQRENENGLSYLKMILDCRIRQPYLCSVSESVSQKLQTLKHFVYVKPTIIYITINYVSTYLNLYYTSNGTI